MCLYQCFQCFAMCFVYPQARDQIVAINQQSTLDMTQQEAAQLLTGSQGTVTLQLLQGEYLLKSQVYDRHVVIL